ncbi:hypothetical protein [Geotalea toluenoxydans]|uniref:hypothetical protein n=1 Tax=Geotalea toluenoxydans TaxID=421624 RepID=UPI000AEE1D4F|nr:hypothetical protein [Geotalea toluenoxydans]
MNDPRNLDTAIKAVIKQGKHAQGTMSYTVSPVDTIPKWVDLAKRIEDMGSHSLCIKDMAGLLSPYTAYELVKKLKKSINIPIHMQCHATTGMSTATYVKAIEAGVENVDTSISSMSMTYGHSATERWWPSCPRRTKRPGSICRFCRRLPITSPSCARNMQNSKGRSRVSMPGSSWHRCRGAC